MRDDGGMRAQCGAESADLALGRAPAPADTADDSDSHLYPRVTSFRSRRSTISEGQQQTWDRLWPQLGAQAGRPTNPVTPLDTTEWFGRSAPVVLEIGSGTGTSTLAMAKAEPDVDVVAVEVYRRGLAQLLAAIDREHVTNIRLVRGDGVDVLEHMFGSESLTGVRVFFPDPWPKVAAPQAPAPSAVHRCPDRRPVAPGRDPARRDRSCGLRRADRRGRRRRAPTAARRRRCRACPSRWSGPITKYETKAQHAGSAVTELVWERA